MRRIVWSLSGSVLLLLAFVPFALKLLAGAAARSPEGADTQLPIGSVCGASWDVEEGVAIVALCEFARVQAYDNQGLFRFGWSVPASGGEFTLARLTEGRYEITTVRGRRRLMATVRGDAPSALAAPQNPGSTHEPPVLKPKLVTRESAMGDKVLMESPEGTIELGGSWLAPFIANEFLSFGFGVPGVICLETWRRKRQG